MSIYAYTFIQIGLNWSIEKFSFDRPVYELEKLI